MASKIKVDNIENQCGGAVVTKCGATTTISGSVVKADDIQAADGGNIINQCGTTITLGASGDTISLAAGASQSGFGREGSVDWQTGDIKTSTFTPTSGEGYFVDTSSGAVTANLPAGSAGAIVAFSDYTRTFQTNNLTVSPNGSEKMGGVAGDAILSTEGQSATFVYVDSTEGWINVQETSNSVAGRSFITATGGTITTCGNFKIHTFTGPGTFCVSAISNVTAENTVGYLVVAGGGGASTVCASGGGGGGGFREGRNVPIDNFTASPLVANAPTNAITLTATGFPITVGGGGPAGCGGPSGNGSNSVFSTITSTGGGGAGSACTACGVGSGGSGGGGGGGNGTATGAGSGNTPPVSPPQGQNGGVGVVSNPFRGSGGGGASQAGGTGSTGAGGNGGNGVGTSIPGSPITKSGGGAGNGQQSGGTGGSGGGGNGFHPGGSGSSGSTNSGGGGGGRSGSGGSGIVVIRYKFQ
jgi:hypothetical protein